MSLFNVQSVEELQGLLTNLKEKSELSQTNEKKQTPIVYWASQEDWEKVEAFLSVDVSSNDPENFGRAASIAIKCGNTDLAMKLLEKTNVSQDEWTLLHCAVASAPDTDDLEGQKAAIQKIEELLKRANMHENCRKKNINGFTPLLLAVKSQKFYLVETLLNAAKIRKDVEDQQLLAEAILYTEKVNPELAKKMLESADPDTLWLLQDKESNRAISPLHLAILRKRKEEIDQLADEADLTVQTASGFNAIRLASRVKDWNTVALLSQAQTDDADSLQYGPVMLSAAYNQLYKLATELVQKGAKLNWFLGTSPKSFNAFHLAVQWKQAEFLDALIESQTNSAQQSPLELKYNGRTPIELAAHLKQWDMVARFARIKPANPEAAGYITAWQAAKADNALDEETLEKLREAAQVEKVQVKVPAKPVDAAEGLQNTSEEDRVFVEAFKKIYQALYAGQSSFFKSRNFIEQQEITKEVIQKHIDAKPESRSAKAVSLARRYMGNMESMELVREIHKYAYDNSGFFKCSPNSKNLYSEDAQRAYEEADENSRTGQIRTALKG
ncbi:Ankyrin repeats (3 copies) [Legionella birminghamensis]|uniref:Ankyrin repeats (3 copies) n=1 Tax=Legionella birminghamensis TaxID=28083 RepID=A0A378I7V3_9GAMM|nr:ankyrin repeat domain-containing protein [Legionella birminghamensis]KTC68042.1 Ankyrin repeats (3 copies) [Legionella birminghamensis]STX31249.1 Ankyrin repeats (3 copies) [Legionella birminghamensis]